jgi:AcrR family transcriptional regulator
MPEPPCAPPPNGQARRRQRTHQAFLDAAAQLLAEGRTSASIEEITRRAGVGFGTFYNHFDTKEQLFEEAVLGLLDSYATWLRNVTSELQDPAESFARSFRLTGRLAVRRADLFAPILNAGTEVMFMERGLRQAALADIRAGIATGRFIDEDPEILLVAVGGALLGLVRLISSGTLPGPDRATDALATRLLCLLGLDAADAHALTARPLPPTPDLHWNDDNPHS